MTDAAAAASTGLEPRRKSWLRKTLRLSQQEAAASSIMTATSDNFFNAFAIYLRASVTQMGWLTAIPQLTGAAAQLLSVWIGAHYNRRKLIVVTATLQALVVAAMALLAAFAGNRAVTVLIALAVGYHAAMYLIQPQWRAWMGSIVPQRRRGAFFAQRTRLTMASSFVVFIGGGALLSLSERLGIAWLGFLLLFSAASLGRGLSAWLLWRMHDPEIPADGKTPPLQSRVFRQTLRLFRESLHDPTFRHYSLFVAGMQGMVAISAPFFAVYQLQYLEFSYFQYSITSVTSIVVQFVTLSAWGRFSDRFGNRLTMIITSLIIPLLPLLWLVSGNFYYLLLVQAISGFAWSGYTLSTANYLYDIRPHRTNFAVYAAVQSGLGAILVFCGALAGGYLAAAAPNLLALLPENLQLRSPVLLVFATSAILRFAVVVWFIPKSVEPRVRQRPELLKIIYRIARFNAISGVVLDWLTVTQKDNRQKKRPYKKPGG